MRCNGCLSIPYIGSSGLIAAPIDTVTLAFSTRAALWASLRRSQKEEFFEEKLLPSRRTSSHLTCRRLQIRLWQSEGLSSRRNTSNKRNSEDRSTNQPVVARNPRPRDLRGFRTPREVPCVTSAIVPHIIRVLRLQHARMRSEMGISRIGRSIVGE